MNTHALVRLAAARGGLTQREMRRALDALVESITGELALGNDVHIAGLGMLRVREYAPGMKYLPAGGQAPGKGREVERCLMMAGGRRTVRLYPAGTLLRALSAEDRHASDEDNCRQPGAAGSPARGDNSPKTT